MKRFYPVYLLVFVSACFSQIIVNATRISEEPVIDGIPNEPVWNSTIPVEDDFIQHRPDCGEPMSEKTEIRVLYDDKNLYFSFIMHDSHPEEFTRRLASRDSDFPGEWIGIWLDTYNDDNNAYYFFTSIDNVQQDGRLCTVSGWDSNWDGIWESATAVSDSGWTAEFAIPFSLLRYSDDEEQEWGINFKRTINRTNESAFLFRMGDNGQIKIQDFGNLLGLNSLPSTRKVEFRPYGAGRIQYLPEADKKWDPWLNAGVDTRIGLSSELLLDLTVNPDFGQVEADPDEANLSHWETYLSEKRPFFLEGSDMFSMPFSLFYSRRIGSVAPDGNIIPILGGAKLTGSINGFRIGFLDAYTGSVKNDSMTLVNPVNYSAGRIVREFGEGTYIGISGTSTDVPEYDGSEYAYGRSGALDAQVTFLENHRISSSVAGTWNSFESVWKNNLAYRTFYRFDNDRFDFSGGCSFQEENFNANMIGYTSSTGDVNTWIRTGLYQPFNNNDVFQTWWGNINARYSRVPGGPVTGQGISFNSGLAFRNRYHINIDLGYNGAWTDRYEGPEGTEYKGGLNAEFSCSTDSRKMLHGYIWGEMSSYCEGTSTVAGMSVIFKPAANIAFGTDLDWSMTSNARKYNWNLDEWDKRDTDWRSIQMTANWMFSNYLSLRLTSQVSRFSADWDTGDNSRNLSHWMNTLLSWQFLPGSMFYFMIGENAEPDEITGEFGKPEFTVFTKLTWFLPA